MRDNQIIEAMEAQGIDVMKAVLDRYAKLHEIEGVGFGDKDKAEFVSFYFVLDDGSYYKDTIPITDHVGGMDNTAYLYSHVLLALFEMTHETKHKIYGRINESLYKH